MENSIAMCYTYLKGIADGADDNGGKRAIRKMEGFTQLMREFEKQAARGFSMHPKMDTLKTLLVDHFAKQLPDGQGGASAPGGQSRAMVFVSFRECVEEIVVLLNKESPIIRAKAFIGQGVDKQGKRGYAQKEQLEVRTQTSRFVRRHITDVFSRSSNSSRPEFTTSLSPRLLAKRV